MDKLNKILEFAKENPKKLILMIVIAIASLIITNACALKLDELHIRGLDTETRR